MINFEKPLRNYLVYDFKVNGLKVQEKVAGNNGDAFKGSLRKSDGKNSKKSYEKGDNDLYWINIPDKNHFYIIPESVLITNGFVVEKDEKGKTSLNLYPDNKKHWTSEYLYSYEKIDIEKIKSNFNL